MNSGKSLQLLARAHDFQEHSIPFIILKSKIDDRNGENVVYSRALGSRECVTISEDDNIYMIIDACCQLNGYVSPKWILVDEAQFLTPEQVDELAAVSDKFGIDVECYGLRTDFRTKLFPGSKRLFEVADYVQEIPSVCYCGNKTMFNARINSNKEIVTEGKQIEIGGEDKYIALCRNCYYKKTNNKLYQNENND